ncbi:hypothetical protein HGA88_01735 [Candidatus Roizmanbacteria bacterium]|nr:hypothetical protein [Candidatus Roizmanbacteria bacterium]
MSTIIRQNELFTLLYRFRFLQRRHFQLLLNHKHVSRIYNWLNQLTQEHYLKKFFNAHTITVSASYSLNTKGRKYIKDHLDDREFMSVKEPVLDRVWREYKYSEQFRNHCLFIADIYVSLYELVQKTKAVLNFRTKVELLSIKNFIFPAPDAFFSLEEQDGSKKYFFLEVFDPSTPETRVTRRIKQYFEYCDRRYWQDRSEGSFPRVVIVLPDVRAKRFTYKQIQRKIAGREEPIFYLSTWEETRTKGMVKEVLQRVVAKDSD